MNLLERYNKKKSHQQEVELVYKDKFKLLNIELPILIFPKFENIEKEVKFKSIYIPFIEDCFIEKKKKLNKQKYINLNFDIPLLSNYNMFDGSELEDEEDIDLEDEWT